jgi:hypothetical protein
MKKPKTLQMLNADSLGELAQGETSYFQDCENLDMLRSNNYREISEPHVVALMESIQGTGVQAEVALVATETPEGEILLTVEDGHHRLEAVRRLRKEAERSGRHWLYRPLPCRVRVAAQDTVKGAFAIASVMRNQLRKEENLWDKLAAFERLREAGETTVGISKLVGMDERSVRRILSLKKIPNTVRRFAKENEDTVKAATLYKLAAAIEKTGADTKNGLSQLMAEVDREGSQRLAIAQDLAQTFLSQTAGDDGEYPVQDICDMISFLALDNIPRVKGEPQDRPSGAEEGRSPSPKPAGKSTTKSPRTTGSKSNRSRIPDGWIAVDPTRLESMLVEAGIPEEQRSKIATLLTSPGT